MKRFLTPAAVLLLLAFTLASAFPAPIILRSETIEPPAKSSLKTEAASPGPAYYIIQFAGPVKDAWKQEVLALGVKLGSYIPEDGFIARMDAKQMARVSALESVRWIERVKPEYRMDSALRRMSPGDVEVTVKLFPGESPSAVEAFVKNVGGTMVSPVQSSDMYLTVSVPLYTVDGLTALEPVEWVEEWVQPRPANNVAQGIIGVHDVRTRISLYGEGQVIAFADSGLDTGDPATLSADFAGRILAAYALRRPNDWSDMTGHGTHAIGVAVNSGVLSGSNPAEHSYDTSFAGVAPESQIVIQSIGDSSGYVYPPLALATLFQPTYDLGARVHSDSWGSPVHGSYTSYSQQVDDFINTHRDFVLVFPMGNDGRDGNSDGVTDLGDAYAPATAKNCIAVGATESVRSDGRNTTYGEAWAADFPAQPLHSDHISDNADGMSSWSCRGPCTDGRIKPDICAPGTNIVSARSHAVSGITGWKVYDPNYVFWGGTSMSTPMIAGTAALVREYYIKNHGIQPSAALVKATLLNGATDITPGQHLIPMEVLPRPNNVEGWGRVNLSETLDPPAPKVVEFVDEGAGLSTGGTRTYQYNVLSSSVPLAVTLVWTDPPASSLTGKQLVNDLDLKVTTPGDQNLLGNGGVDSTNNVESVDIASPAVGTYTITITARTVPSGPQTFALVTSGALPGGYIAGTIRTPSGNPISGVTVEFADGGLDRTTVTGQNGDYSIHLPSDSYIVIPSKTGWDFTPDNRFVSLLETGITGVDFTGTAPAGRITGTATRALGGRTNYVLESDHPYADNTDVVYTITGPPGATHIRVHFDEINLENGYDIVYVEDAEGTMVDQFTGEISDQWSQYVDGNVLRVHLTSNPSTTYYGFHIDGYETDIIQQGPVAGVTVRAEPGGATAVTGPDGSYTIDALEPISYTITPELPRWKFSPDRKAVTVEPGGTTSGQNFLAFPPGSISGTVLTGRIEEVAQGHESEHPYAEDTETIETITHPGASRIRVHFTEIAMEAGWDFIDIMDPANNIIDTYSGSYSDQWSSWVTGDTLQIRLQSDWSNTDYGYYMDRYAIIVDEHGMPGVTVTAQPSGLSAITNASGAYTIPNVDTGLCHVTAAKPYWEFDPSIEQVNVVAGLGAAGTNFYGSLLSMPGTDYLKSLPDGSDVSVSGKVATAGTDQLPGCFYIEESDRHSGIKVTTTETVHAGDIVTVSGAIRTSEGERYIDAGSRVTVTSSTGQIPDPLGLVGLGLGGNTANEYTPGVMNGVGLNNVGLLVRMWGRVSFSETGVFYLDDGSALESEPDKVGVKVLCGSLTPPQANSYVQVTGISSCQQIGSDFIRVIRVRQASDITPVVTQ